jgi:hypothetical protein
MTVDNFRNSAGERSDGRGDKRTVEEISRYFLPCILTASIAAAAASGSR